MSPDPITAFLKKNNDIFVCPVCLGKFSKKGRLIKCGKCKREYPVDKEIPLVYEFVKNPRKESVTDIIKSFYEENPFPNYEDIDSPEILRKKALEGVFAQMLDAEIHYKANILEAGCGTGQLSNFLALTWGRRVFATDICLNSLGLGSKFAKSHKIDNVYFTQMNLFKPCFRPESFDVVISNGVLHHTEDPYRGFKSLASLVKENGYIIIGLYNKYGRLTTDLRRTLFNVTGDSFKFLDPRLRNKNVSELRKDTWFMDQYKNPHESKHSIDEVLKWFDKTGFKFVNSVPQILPEDTGNIKLFADKPKGSHLDRIFAQLDLMVSGGREGGFFVMIGKKKIKN